MTVWLLITASIVLLMAVASIYLLTKLKKVSLLATRDSLTGAYNREGFIREAERGLHSAGKPDTFAILFFNIKGFKAINELFGAEAGDKVLKESVAILQRSDLHPLVIARFESDHFVCLVRQKDIDYDKLIEMCSRVYIGDSKRYNFYGRCGIYLIDDNSRSVIGMCDRAKLAKDYIEDDYVKPYAIYNKSMRDGFVTDREMTSELGRALANKEFEVYYQPVFSLGSERIESAEALIRWNHPHKGLLSPGHFIPIFEKNGYISELDNYVGASVRNYVGTRLAAGEYVVPVAVNLSRMDFYDMDLMEKLIEIVSNSQFSMDHTRIEITESAYMVLAENNEMILQQLKDCGVKILLDDFGSGYSSFSSIRDFSFDIIKIDMGFTKCIESSDKARWVIGAIVDLAHNIGSTVVAEGVETQAQADFLKSVDCDLVQGFLYSHPIKEQDFSALLDKQA